VRNSCNGGAPRVRNSCNGGATRAHNSCRRVCISDSRWPTHTRHICVSVWDQGVTFHGHESLYITTHVCVSVCDQYVAFHGHGSLYTPQPISLSRCVTNVWPSTAMNHSTHYNYQLDVRQHRGGPRKESPPPEAERQSPNSVKSFQNSSQPTCAQNDSNSRKSKVAGA
jgi:hypothetical protein